ncbi:MAG TPA: M28 family peptidase, partial [Planctomycetota bacterium]|nr:M28 family peptidase [Planctomycetota bacterium]
MRPRNAARDHLRFSLLPLALVLTACGSATCGGSAPPAGEPRRAFDSERAWALLAEQVALGPRPAGSEAAEATRALIERELRSAGLQPMREPFTASTPIGEIEMCNVWAEVRARAGGEAAPVVEIGSHFDTKRMEGFVGANDGASSTAVLLALARAIAAAPSESVTWRVVFFDGEEAVREHWADPDNRYGSRHRVAELRESGELARVKAFVLLDLVGDRDLVLTRDEYSGRELQALFDRAARSIGLGANMSGARLPVKDDHQSYLEAGVESIDLID